MVMSKRISSDRRLHLMDIENIVGCARPTRQEVETFRCRYAELGLFKPGDHLVLACNHGAALEVIRGWPSGRLLVRSGPNGADEALLGVLVHESVVSRFSEVVLCSGDGIFTEAVAGLTSIGLVTTVVSRAGALATRLMRVASSVVLLVNDPDPVPNVAALDAA
jgi:hypothetical protein